MKEYITRDKYDLYDAFEEIKEVQYYEASCKRLENYNKQLKLF